MQNDWISLSVGCVLDWQVGSLAEPQTHLHWINQSWYLIAPHFRRTQSSCKHFPVLLFQSVFIEHVVKPGVGEREEIFSALKGHIVELKHTHTHTHTHTHRITYFNLCIVCVCFTFHKTPLSLYVFLNVLYHRSYGLFLIYFMSISLVEVTCTRDQWDIVVASGNTQVGNLMGGDRSVHC